LTSAYSVYPNYGFQAKPYFIQRVYDRTGRLLEETEPETQQVLSSQTAFIMTSLLTTVVRAGTGANVVSRGFTRPAGGKTGTTNDYSDAWFIGFTPQIACGVWVGVDERRSMGSGVTGSVGAIPAWVSVMKALHRDLPEKGFGQPEGIITERVCTKSHLIATRYCPDAVIEIFPAASAIDTCDVHAVTKSLKKHDVMIRFGTDKKDPEIKPAGRKRALMF
jgi:penicillin-binding protein 1A